MAPLTGGSGEEIVIETGGQVAKKPEAPPELELVRFAVMMDEPGCCAVATPFWSMVKMLEFCAE